MFAKDRPLAVDKLLLLATAAATAACCLAAASARTFDERMTWVGALPDGLLFKFC